MMTKLYETGKHEVLREIQSGVLSPLEVFGYWNADQLDHLPSAATLRTVDPTIPEWIDTHDVTATTRRNYKSEVVRFVRQQGNVPISHLPTAVAAYRAYCMERNFARTFNALRTVMLAYLHKNFGKSSPLWNALTDLPVMTVTVKRQAPQLTVPEAHDLIQALPAAHAEIAKAMMLTGMHWAEVMGKWEVGPDRVIIHGTKTATRTRFVPLLDASIQHPTRESKAFRTALRTFRDDLSPYTFRRSFAHWMELAKIPRSRRKLYLGHSMGSKVTDLYERHDVERFLAEDAESLKSFIFEQWRQKDRQQTPKQSRPIGILSKRKGTEQ